MTAPSLTDGPGLDYEVVPDSGTPSLAGPVWDEQPEQPAAAVVPTVELKGRRFPIREEGVSLLALMKFATIAKRQQAQQQQAQQDPAVQAAQEMEGLAALYALLRSCIAPAAWDDFEDHANEAGAQQEDLMRVVQGTAQARSGRPTQQPSASPGGRSTTAPSSAAGSSSPGSSIRQGDPRVQQHLEQQGRPDLALVVVRAREAAQGPSTRSSTG